MESDFSAPSFQDCSKILWSGHHILRNDPRRQWTTGLTIENTSAMVTQPFDFRVVSFDYCIAECLLISIGYPGTYRTHQILAWHCFQITRESWIWHYHHPS